MTVPKLPAIPRNTVDVGKCTRCRRVIRFVKLDNGRRIPVELEPDDTGRLAAYYEPTVGMYTGGWFPDADVLASRFFSGDRFTPHSDTCRRKGARG